jgi:hypothetical protein
VRGERDARENSMEGGVGDLLRQGGVREKQWGGGGLAVSMCW